MFIISSVFQLGSGSANQTYQFKKFRFAHLKLPVNKKRVCIYKPQGDYSFGDAKG